MEKQYRNPAGIAKYTKNIISPISITKQMKSPNNFFQKLSSKYYKDAKLLGYTWLDLIRKDTRQRIINEIHQYRSAWDQILYKAKLDTFADKMQIKYKMDQYTNQRTIIKETDKALKGYTSSYKISIKHTTDPLLQLQNTRKAVEYHIRKVLSAMKGLKFIETLEVTFSKTKDDGLIYKSAFFNSKPQTIINYLSIHEALQLTKQQILNFVAQWISEGSGWTIQSVDNHYINIVKYEPMKGNSYIKLPQEC